VRVLLDFDTDIGLVFSIMAPAEPEARPFELIGQEPYFEEEREGWKGYIEWEKYPEKKKQAAEIMAKYDFPVVSGTGLRSAGDAVVG
jgi:hypothetical protein